MQRRCGREACQVKSTISGARRCAPPAFAWLTLRLLFVSSCVYAAYSSAFHDILAIDMAYKASLQLSTRRRGVRAFGARPYSATERVAIIGYQQARKSLHLHPNPNALRQRRAFGPRAQRKAAASSFPRVFVGCSMLRHAPLASACFSSIQSSTHTCLICCQDADPVASRKRLNRA